ncbi:hypothetical protein [Bacillus chungangensis]|uniref:Uncharacterized protein n=1 Tax=Bacillus chungangensis TaxID=587633 RepID=A0ABT9WUH5_9BACI|nr:hypothetical protein [Bacillus chungangensis]MDQ0176951.1 hypothetical protein [Bacillus chungangensis]
MKKIFLSSLVVMMLFSLSVPAFASTTDQKIESVVETMSGLENEFLYEYEGIEIRK